MPVYITVDHGDPDTEYELIALLCENNWDIAPQMYALEVWLKANKELIRAGAYVADVCFAVRKDAGTGGGTFSPVSMRTMSDLGISLFLSEYVIDPNDGSVAVPVLPKTDRSGSDKRLP